jgi:uncharacterized protein (TIGR00645 family)
VLSVERLIERLLFASRWLLVPLYLGLAVFLLALIAEFYSELYHFALSFRDIGATDLVLIALSLVDLVLVASLVVMVMLSGYENFVAKIDIAAAQANLAWLGKLDQGSLKLKLAVSIVAISAIHLLGAFMDAERTANDKLLVLVVIHLTFVVSALLLTVMDRLVAKNGH